MPESGMPAAVPSGAAPPAPAGRRRWLRRLAVAAGILVVAAGLFVVFAIPPILSSDAAAKTASDLLTQRLGRPTTIADLEFGWGSGLAVRGVRIASPPGFADRPFFAIRAFAVRPRVRSLFSGRFVIDDVVIEGPDIYVERHADGAMNLPALEKGKTPAAAGPAAPPMSSAAPAASPPAAATAGGPPIEIEVRHIALSNARFTLNDAALGKPLEVEGLGFTGRAEVLASRTRCVLDSIGGRINGGPVTGGLTLQDGPEGAVLEAALHAQDVRLGLELTNLLKSFLPLLAVVPSGDAVQGKLQFRFEAAGKGKTRDEMLGALTGKASLDIRDGAFEGSPLLQDLAKVLREPKLARYAFKDHRATFTIRERKFFNDLGEFTGDAPATMKGWVDFDQQMDYQVVLDPKAFGKNAIVAKALESLNREGGLRVTGPVDHPKVRFDPETVLRAGAKAYLEEAVKDRVEGALERRGIDVPGAGAAPEAIEKGIEGLLRRRKK